MQHYVMTVSDIFYISSKMYMDILILGTIIVYV